MTSFYYELLKKINESLFNSYTDNYCSLRYGAEQENPDARQERDYAEKGLVSRDVIGRLQQKIDQEYKTLFPALEYVYSLLENESSRQLMVDLTAYRLLGHTKVKLYDQEQLCPKVLEDKLKECIVPGNDIDTGFAPVPTLQLIDMTPIGKKLRLYSTVAATIKNFFVQQYAYVNEVVIRAEPGDYVIDAGGCWGDTAVYFADCVGDAGKVFTFEFIPSNIDILQKCIQANPAVAPSIQLVPSPIWSKSDVSLFYRDNGPGSTVNMSDINGRLKDSVNTLSIDDLVARSGIRKIDFIKMDIEGAELEALKGAEKVIRQYRPKLAICVYHNGYVDMVTIPIWLKNLNLGYKLYLKHSTTFAEETVLFAAVSD